MNATWRAILGPPKSFLAQVPQLASRFVQRAGAASCDLASIRAFVRSRNYEITNEPEVFREVLAAFVCVLIDFYALDVRIGGILRKRIEIVNTHYRGELLDLFYRCVFEGLDLAPDGEGLGRSS